MIRTRFAPSPTGDLHLGNVRTAAFNWLFARHHGGTFVLRIEDTDIERNVAGAEAGLLRDLKWLGLTWDEGPDVGGPFGPYRQSERENVYLDGAERLLESGVAYRCYCTPDELEAEADATTGRNVVRYSGRCRDLTEAECEAFEKDGRRPAIRFRVPGVDEVEIEDEVRGRISFPESDFSDFIILRADGRPTYNFAVVVDDAAMEITHVVRGVGHLSNTPRQALLFDALGHARPVFAHLPTVLAPGGGKLSKRAGASSVAELRDAGYHPEGVVNYLSLLGWSSEDEDEVLSRARLISDISLERLGASDTTYDPEKLRWLSGRHIARMELDDLVDAVTPYVESGGFPLQGDRLRTAVDALRSRLNTFSEIEPYLREFFYPPEGPELVASRRELVKDPGARRVISATFEALGGVSNWKADTLGASVRSTGTKIGVRGRELFHPLRRALTGAEHGPDLGMVLEGLGREEVLRRLGLVLEKSPV